MSTKTTQAIQHATLDSDADIDRFLSGNHEEIARKLAAGRDEIILGKATPLEPLEALLQEARARQ